VFGRSRRLEDARREFADALGERLELSAPLIEAFASVPRERFLPPGPWLLLEGTEGYASTPDADPVRVYRDAAIGIDPSRLLNNSQPSLFARLLEELRIAPGERVVHLGCATGYYTALLAALVGSDGAVQGVEIDPRILRQAKRALRRIRHVSVEQGDAVEYDAGPADVILVDGGVTHAQPQWLDRLLPGGRLCLALTAVRPPTRMSRLLRNDVGRLLVVTREGAGFSARFGEGLGISALYGGKDAERQRDLDEAFRRGGHRAVRSLRRDAHERQADCWFHSDGFCLSHRSQEVSAAQGD
jgi:protein-L-isoaspartate(D-aspartate) O-methyltransferase